MAKQQRASSPLLSVGSEFPLSSSNYRQTQKGGKCICVQATVFRHSLWKTLSLWRWLGSRGRDMGLRRNWGEGRAELMAEGPIQPNEMCGHVWEWIGLYRLWLWIWNKRIIQISAVMIMPSLMGFVFSVHIFFTFSRLASSWNYFTTKMQVNWRIHKTELC